MFGRLARQTPLTAQVHMWVQTNTGTQARTHILTRDTNMRSEFQISTACSGTLHDLWSRALLYTMRASRTFWRNVLTEHYCSDDPSLERMIIHDGLNCETIVVSIERHMHEWYTSCTGNYRFVRSTDEVKGYERSRVHTPPLSGACSRNFLSQFCLYALRYVHVFLNVFEGTRNKQRDAS